MKLSEFLLQQIEDLDKDREWWEGPTDPQFEEFHQFLDRFNIDSVESLLPEDLAKLASLVRSRKDLLEWSLDDQYSRTLVKQIPKIVRRAQQLEPMYVKQTLQGPVETYLREATRAYLFGLFQASVALSRSALEKGLRDVLRANASLLAQADELFGLVRAAARSKLLEPALQQFSDEIRRSANDVLHGTPCDEQDAFDLLIKTRKVLGSLYDQKK